MKILMVSMVSIHFTRWVGQLRDSGHDIYWFDPLDGSYSNKQLDWLTYCKNWRLKWDFPGRYVIKNKIPWLYKIIKHINERPVAVGFETFLKEVQPDVVHSFVMFNASVPILPVMKNNPEIKWIYSAWGSDLFYFQNDNFQLLKIKQCLPFINYMFSDCHRDFDIATKYGFRGVSLGVFPGGGGYMLSELERFIQPINNRNIVLIKGIENNIGRCNVVLDALLFLKEQLNNFDIIVYGIDDKVIKHAKHKKLTSWNNFKLLPKISQGELLKLKGQSLIYIGNSISDGIPNTLLEAIVMGAFPIQSNPGGATAEIIKDGLNGLIIENPFDSKKIAELIFKVINSKELIIRSFNYNQNFKKQLDYNYIKDRVIESYNLLQN